MATDSNPSPNPFDDILTAEPDHPTDQPPRSEPADFGETQPSRPVPCMESRVYGPDSDRMDRVTGLASLRRLERQCAEGDY